MSIYIEICADVQIQISKSHQRNMHFILIYIYIYIYNIYTFFTALSMDAVSCFYCNVLFAYF
jgi:hypothetical protein